MNLILFGVYALILVMFFAFIGIVIMHVGAFREYSKYLSVVLKVYIVTIIVIAIFGGYKILTHYTPPKKSETPKVRLDF